MRPGRRDRCLIEALVADLHPDDRWLGPRFSGSPNGKALRMTVSKEGSAPNTSSASKRSGIGLSNLFMPIWQSDVSSMAPMPLP
jgi:hypothetical protein